MGNGKKIPLRRCSATGEMFPKKEMIRVVRTKEGEVSVDPTGKKSGRGTYISKSEKAVEMAKKRHSLDSQLGVKVPEGIYDEVLRLILREKLL
ncbi:hypothetical protein SAMN04488127_0193 [Bhargavaea ginsengi]|uniref:YlxR domain-containing protein n=1 Tax=Bhargavaea ginsengi TaxID=426757 RepID=A0A1H6SM42_9BACL|nr:YlxR family protein [Bhargavaea ginsengi]MCM3087426.1 YlxR family protein [Bhargavaea ginsengi]SEI68963.1 hypothetical protein SAMN04488127_0193 [Bhargavaea ginsengi]